MESNSPKRELQMEGGESESASQKRAKTNPEEKEDGKIDYTIQRRSPSLVNNPSSHSTTKKDAVSSQRPFGTEKTSMSFPEKIMRILSFSEFANVIRWNPEGTEFCIVPDSFSETVLEPHFQGTKFQSFTRKLNRWGFKRILDEDKYPKGTFAYRHEYFQRDREELMKSMEIDSDKKQRKLQVPVPVVLGDDATVSEESKDENRLRSLDNFANQLSGVLTSPTSAAGLPVASTVAHLPTQSEMNRIQLMLENQRALQQQILFGQTRLPVSRQGSFPGAATSFDPLLSSLNIHSSQMQVPTLDSALARGLSLQRQDQLAQALHQLPGQRQQLQGQQLQGQQSIDPLLLQLLLARQPPERRHSSPEP